MKIIIFLTLLLIIFMPCSYVISQEDFLYTKSIKAITVSSPQIERLIIMSDGEKASTQEWVTEINLNLMGETSKILKKRGFIIRDKDTDVSLLIEGQSVEMQNKQHFKDWTKSVLLGIFTLGLVIRAPDNGWSLLDVSLIDNKTKKTLWTKREKIANRHLTSPRIVRHLIKRALKDFPEL